MNCLSFSNSKFVRFCLFVCLEGGSVGTSWKSGLQSKKGLNRHLHKQANIKFVNSDYICWKNRCHRVQKQKKIIWWKLDSRGSFLIGCSKWAPDQRVYLIWKSLTVSNMFKFELEIMTRASWFWPAGGRNFPASGVNETIQNSLQSDRILFSYHAFATTVGKYVGISDSPRSN